MDMLTQDFLYQQNRHEFTVTVLTTYDHLLMALFPGHAIPRFIQEEERPGNEGRVLPSTDSRFLS